MSKNKKYIILISGIIIATVTAAAIKSGTASGSCGGCSAEDLVNPRPAQGTQDVDGQLWKVCLALHRGLKYTDSIAEAYKNRDAEKIKGIMSTQDALTLPRCRKQLEVTAVDDIADYRDEVFLVYAFYFRLLELCESDEVLKQAAKKDSDETYCLPEEYVSAMTGFSSHMTRCAQRHGGYLLSCGYSKDKAARIFARNSFDKNRTALIMRGSQQICALINGQYADEVYKQHPQTTDKKELDRLVEQEKMTDNYLWNFPIPSAEDKVWNAARYLDLSARNALRLVQGKSKYCGEESRAAVLDWLAADLSVCRGKIASLETTDAPEVRQAALEMCGAVDGILAHAAEYRIGKVDKSTYLRLLRADEEALNKKCAVLYRFRQAYLMRVLEEEGCVQSVMERDGLKGMTI